ncbi:MULTISPECIES: hypothetical protein [unclassified Nocardia]|uniref:hypothetical protein n=1 Tax=unclassified Nocardia TaxID=2637762 RepID=UPI00278BFB71|nr:MULTISPECIES: hypothetical protein [unclassified Nocardia]
MPVRKHVTLLRGAVTAGVAVAVLSLNVTALVGCGGSGSSASAYCDAVAEVGDIGVASSVPSLDVVTKIGKVADVAPEGIATEWQALADALEQAISARDKATPEMANPSQTLADLDRRVKNSAQIGVSVDTVIEHVTANCGDRVRGS